MTRAAVITAAHGKLNLALCVIGHRPDGFHEIDGVSVRLGLHDLIQLRLLGPGEPSSLTMSGASEGLPDGDENLALAAASRLEEAAGRGFEVRLHKRIPSRAGLGGGSADAAAVLEAGAGLLVSAGTPLGRGLLGHLAAELGSDVPSMLGDRAAVRTRGRGERTEAVHCARRHVAVCLLARCATADVYREADPSEWEGPERVERLLATLSSGLDPGPHLGSGLEAAAGRVAPAVASGLARLRARSSGWQLTGSGGAAYCVAPSATAARTHATAAAAISEWSWSGTTLG